MKKLIFFSVLTLLFSAVTASAQFGRRNLTAKTEQLVRVSSDLSSRASDDLRRGISNSRNEIENAFLASQIEASSRLFEQMVRDNRRDSELRDALSIINDLVRRAPSFGSQSFYWSDLRRRLDDVEREVTGGGSGDNSDNRSIIGRVRWRGTVDDEVQLVIRGNSVIVRTISGRAYSSGNYNFTSSLPNRNVEVEVDKKKGRGKAEVIQQPSRFNSFTTIVRITDKNGGAKDYDVDIFWREGNRDR